MIYYTVIFKDAYDSSMLSWRVNNHIIHRNIQMGSQTTARYDSGGNIPTKSFQNTGNHALVNPNLSKSRHSTKIWSYTLKTK